MKSEDSIKSKYKFTEKPKVEVNINVDEDKRFYRCANLNVHEVNYLLKKDYIITEKKSLVSGKKELFMLKPRFNESVNHMFMVYDIADFLERKGIKVKKFILRNPDISFIRNSRKIGIEIETGKRYIKNKKAVIRKIDELNNKYDFWFFVVTDKKFIKKYRKLGKVIDLRCIVSYLNYITKKVPLSTSKFSCCRKIYRR